MLPIGRPESWLKNPAVIEFLSQVSYRMTNVTDLEWYRVAVRSCVTGIKQGKTVDFCSTIVHENTPLKLPESVTERLRNPA